MISPTRRLSGAQEIIRRGLSIPAQLWEFRASQRWRTDEILATPPGAKRQSLGLVGSRGGRLSVASNSVAGTRSIAAIIEQPTNPVTEHSVEHTTLMRLAMMLDAVVEKSVFTVTWPGAWDQRRQLAELRIQGGPTGPYCLRDSHVATLFIIADTLVLEFDELFEVAITERFKFDLTDLEDLTAAKDLIQRRFQSK